MSRKLYVEYDLNGEHHKDGPFETAEWAFELFNLLVGARGVQDLAITTDQPPKQYVQLVPVPKENP